MIRQTLDNLIRKTADQGINPRLRCAFLMSIDATILALREMMFTPHYPGSPWSMNNDPDCVFLYEGIPARLRKDVAPGHVFIAPNEGFPPRTCCDQTAIVTIMMSIRRGDA